MQWYVAEFESGVQVQRGLQALANGVASAPVTIAEVDPSKSFVLISERIASASANADENWTVRARLTSGTTLTLDRLRTDAAASAQVAWQVVRMQAALVQRGTLCIGPVASCPLVGRGMTAGLNNGAALATAVDTAKSFVLLTWHGGTTINGVEALHQVRGDFTTTGSAVTGLTFHRVQTSTTATQRVEIAYEVVSLRATAPPFAAARSARSRPSPPPPRRSPRRPLPRQGRRRWPS